MPGRIARSTRAPATTAPSSRTPRGNSSTVDIPDEGPSTALRRLVSAVFVDAQKSIAGHRKLCVTLRKIQEKCCYEPVRPTAHTDDPSDDPDEDDFHREVVRCVLRVLQIKKAEPAGDRLVRFLGTFLARAAAQDQAIVAEQGDGDEETTAVPETPTARLTTCVLHALLPLMGARDKVVRFRATQVTSHIVNSLDALDDGLFHRLRGALLRRVHDREAMVRLQAVYGLGRLAAEVADDDDTRQRDGSDSDSDSDTAAGRGVLAKLLHVLQHDPAAEVRRNLLLNLPLTKDVLPYLLERARDADGATRRALYARLLPALGDFRHLSLTHREKLLRWGLRDRDDAVRRATARLFRERWIEDCAALPGGRAVSPAPDAAATAAQPSLDALLELLERIDVVNAGGADGVAVTAMREFWIGRPDYVDHVSFPEAFWADLQPEAAFVVRTFNEFCRGGGASDGNTNNDDDRRARAEEKLPEVTRFGLLLQREIDLLADAVQAAATGAADGDGGEHDDDDAEEACAAREYVVEQLLHVACTLDYADEMGRRTMFGVVRGALGGAHLPEEATRLAVDVLRLVCGGRGDAGGERQFCGVVVEAIAEVHDTVLGDDEEDETVGEDSFHSAASRVGEEGDRDSKGKRSKRRAADADEPEDEHDDERAVREIMVNMKCLHVALCMLQNVSGELEANVHLVTMLNNLVVPAVRSQEAPIRERGLVCLGLCCLLSKPLAEENLTLFLHCFAKGHATLQTIALQILCDVLITHPSLIPPDSPNPQPSLRKPLLKALTKSLRSPDAAVAATGATSLCKLLLARHHLTDPTGGDDSALRPLVAAFFDPTTAAQPGLRQALAYSLPVYARSRPDNARRMAAVAVAVVAKVLAWREEALDEMGEGSDVDVGLDAMTVVRPAIAGGMLVDWTDPRKVLGATLSSGVEGLSPHLVLADRVLERLVTCGCGNGSKEERKVWCGMLAKLFLGSATGAGHARATPVDGDEGEAEQREKELLESALSRAREALESGAGPDVTSRNAVSKVFQTLMTRMNTVAGREREAVGGAEEEATEAEETMTLLDGPPDAEGTRMMDG